MLDRVILLAASVVLAGCAARVSSMPPGRDWREYVLERSDPSLPPTTQWRPEVCAGVDLRPDFRTLDEGSLVSFLRSRRLEVHVEHEPVEADKPALAFVFVAAPWAARPVVLRVATLPTSDAAGRALYDGLLQRGDGAWGVRRSNLAVLGLRGAGEDDLAFAGKSGLACWGTYTMAASGDATVVPGGYAEP